MEFNIHNTNLGKTISIPERYDASLLFRIPRLENRIQYNIDNNHLPFVGFDVWNCYEISFLTNNGLPIVRTLKIIYPASSQFLVESKSLKLYLFSFNMENCGETIASAVEKVSTTITNDLISLLETDVKVAMFDVNSSEIKPFNNSKFIDLVSAIPLNELESIKFKNFTEAPHLLRSRQIDKYISYSIYTDLLRSNCRVTNQPDWGDLYFSITSKHQIDLGSILEYLVSFRKENHFHEEVVEMIYKRLWDLFQPNSLMVGAMYTRRGGIDINPIRASHSEIIDPSFISSECRNRKTLRQ